MQSHGLIPTRPPDQSDPNTAFRDPGVLLHVAVALPLALLKLQKALQMRTWSRLLGKPPGQPTTLPIVQPVMNLTRESQGQCCQTDLI